MKKTWIKPIVKELKIKEVTQVGARVGNVDGQRGRRDTHS